MDVENRTLTRLSVSAGGDGLQQRIAAWWERCEQARRHERYFYFQPLESLAGAWVETAGARKLLFATYNYLGLLGHPQIAAAAQTAIAHYGTGTPGVPILGGTLSLHRQLEQELAAFFDRDDALIYSSGYVANLTTISALVGRGDWVISDRWNHASIVDGCMLAQGTFVRFRHNDMQDLERVLRSAPPSAGKLVVADAVFSMDGDVFNLPVARELCYKYGARLMVDEAHSLGVLGESGRGIEEHYGMAGSIDVKMGTLSKAIPASGGFIAGDRKLINFLRHTARGYVFSAALPPGTAAAALAALALLGEEGAARRALLAQRATQFITGLQAAGFDTGLTSTSIVPIMVGSEERALAMTAYCHQHGLFVLPVLPPAVPEGAARLRANVTAAHTEEDIVLALEIFQASGAAVGVLAPAPL